MSPSGVREAFHLKKTNLVKTSGENINNVTIVGCTFSQVVIELLQSAGISAYSFTLQPYLQSFLIIFDIVPIDIMM